MTVLPRNNVRVIGDGERVLMFAHGYGCDQNMWRQMTPDFSDEFKIVLFDYIGSGFSDAKAFDSSRYSTLRGYSQDILDIASELDLTRINFVGHSVSSMIGALACIAEPNRFETITMIGPSPCYINDGDYVGGFEQADIDGLLESLESNLPAWSATMAPVIMGNLESPELAKELETSFCRMDPYLARNFARVTFLSDNRADLPLLSTKTLILQCLKDAISGVQVGEYVHKCIPNSQIVMMRASGHCPHMSAPKEVTREIKMFLEGRPR